MFKRLCIVLTLLTGCRTKETIPTSAGTSVTLIYPVVLVGQGDVAVRDDQAALVSASLSGGMNFMERKLVDSTGTIYEVKKAITLGTAKAWWRDMGASQESYFLDLQKTRMASLDLIKRLVLEQVESPRSVWSGDPKAVARVKEFASVAELIAGCRNSWEWNR